MIPLGTRIRTKVTDYDTDDYGNERVTPVGTIGIVAEDISHPQRPDAGPVHGIPASQLGCYYIILWENGAWTNWYEAEIRLDAEILEN